MDCAISEADFRRRWIAMVCYQLVIVVHWFPFLYLFNRNRITHAFLSCKLFVVVKLIKLFFFCLGLVFVSL